MNKWQEADMICILTNAFFLSPLKKSASKSMVITKRST
ncbi:hypothetical protein 2200_scaffold1335_00017 [Bacteriophage sp.]|nr:hypothetical protein 2200_scaffold1335_00017 [Bacteriophage sp.]